MQQEAVGSVYQAWPESFNQVVGEAQSVATLTKHTLGVEYSGLRGTLACCIFGVFQRRMYGRPGCGVLSFRGRCDDILLDLATFVSPIKSWVTEEWGCSCTYMLLDRVFLSLDWFVLQVVHKRRERTFFHSVFYLVELADELSMYMYVVSIAPSY